MFYSHKKFALILTILIDKLHKKYREIYGPVKLKVKVDCDVIQRKILATKQKLAETYDWQECMTARYIYKVFMMMMGYLRRNFIMLTCPCNVLPLTPHFYIVKLGFTGVYIISLFLL